MGKYGNVKAQDIIKIAENNGWHKLRQKGSHATYTNGYEIIIIPVHPGKTLGTGLASKLMKIILKK